jgi:Na+-driven multidrug efflux pump
MKDSWGPLKALAAASVINGVGDLLLCSVCGYGIAGAAWATMVSQVGILSNHLIIPCFLHIFT